METGKLAYEADDIVGRLVKQALSSVVAEGYCFIMVDMPPCTLNGVVAKRNYRMTWNVVRARSNGLHVYSIAGPGKVYELTRRLVELATTACGGLVDGGRPPR